eukprot:CAMPEP_0196683366 /NCGR_PEP_ID=MMETSP1090-20130531/9854_1 /TAXON_ID=37098 /ORGANISM="Isochrysis sp, Strain CCMP1244" /LENGTH=148 /DNA_ID=CAMNT_0042021807 /DNA_START=340 /DNA_END=782 /DNA_ORIENTATION=-
MSAAEQESSSPEGAAELKAALAEVTQRRARESKEEKRALRAEERRDEERSEGHSDKRAREVAEPVREEGRHPQPHVEDEHVLLLRLSPQPQRLELGREEPADDGARKSAREQVAGRRAKSLANAGEKLREGQRVQGARQDAEGEGRSR